MAAKTDAKTAAAAAAVAAAKADAAASTRTCACGCGESVVRNFKQGHDQRMVSKLAQDLVYGNVWDGRAMGILSADEAKSDIQGRIDKVTSYVRAKLTDPLATKVYNAAHRAWELEKNADSRAADKEAKRAAREAAKEAKASRKKDKAATAATAPAAEPKLITKATASNDDVDAAEAALPAGSMSHSLGQAVQVLVGKRRRNGVVHGMNQAGKVTAVKLTTGGVETIKTEGFTVLPG